MPSGAPVAEATAAGTGGAWTSGPAVPALTDGSYSAIAIQPSSIPGNHAAETTAIKFAVDTVAPQVTLATIGAASPSGVQRVGGSASRGAGDLQTVTVQLFAGPGVGESQVQTITVSAVVGAWSATFAGLAPGTYTARALQSDNAGNVGVSAPASFAVPQTAGPAAGAAAAAPHASFSWYPATPHVGERVSLASTSTASSPLTAFAWDLAGNGSFQPGAPIQATTFSTPGAHVVHLRVTDANGVSAQSAATITVTPARAALMQPFPLVRILTTRTRSGIRLSLLVVQASPGAHVTVSCHGRACPVRSQSRVATAAGKSRVASVDFRRFERTLRAGTILQIRVVKPGQIGKYTSLEIRHRGVQRVDACLPPGQTKPTRCPLQ
jgi:hypothetical protein